MKPKALQWFIIALAAAVLLWPFGPLAGSARGKGAPLAATVEPAGTEAALQAEAIAQAQTLALADPRVQALLAGKRSEVFWVRPVGRHYPASSAQCAQADCRQVELYNFDDSAAVTAIIDLGTGQVLDVLSQPGLRPPVSQRMYQRAVEIIRQDAEVIAELGYVPDAAAVHPMEADMPGTSCDAAGAICVAATFGEPRSLLWVVVDLTADKVAGLTRTPTWPDTGGALPAAADLQGVECPAPGSVSRDGWTLGYETTATDGLRVFDAAYAGMPVLASAKLVEWHVDYGSTGFRDATGCGPSSGLIVPYGETEVRDLLDDNAGVAGFEVVQDFRMGAWGERCNYRYQQHMQFFADGRFRIVSAAFGQGCSTVGTYRGVMRIDIDAYGGAGDSFAAWDGAAWQAGTLEGWWPQTGAYHASGAKWRVTDQSGRGYLVVPGQGQFDDGGRGDNAFLYVTQHKPSEGDTDIGFLGTCCSDTEAQGPEKYFNGESVVEQNLVLWYVPQQVFDVPSPDAADDDSYYCWTVQGEPDPITYPCFAGPMFVPLYSYFFPYVPGPRP